MVDLLSSPIGPIRVEQAQLADLPAALEILAEAARWLTERQIQQWSYPPPGLPNFLRSQIEQGDFTGALFEFELKSDG